VVDKNPFAERGRSLEEDYFRRKEQEVIDKLRQKARSEEYRRRLAEHTGIADEEVLKDLQELGYNPGNLILLHLVPLLQTAWADGKMTDKERALILQAARAHGVEAGSEADTNLGRWLIERPSQAQFDKGLRAVSMIMQAMSAETRTACERDMIAMTTALATVSGGILGFGRISPEEKQILAQIAEELKGRGK
jgi:tellurite resistance protein